MPLVTSKGLLQDALCRGYAVPAFNVMNVEMLQAVVAACEAERAPLILQFNPGGLRHVGLTAAAVLGRAAAEVATIPVALHLDHATDFALCVQALRAGFTSLMFDGSALPFEANVEETARISALGHAADVPVEGELGALAGQEEGVVQVEAAFTDPEQAYHFIRLTHVDALAISVGNAHGQMRGTVALAIDRIVRIREATGIPLVLHGGSGVSDDSLRAAITAGICKVNVATELHRTYIDALRRYLAADAEVVDPRPLMAAVRQAVQETAQEKVRLFGATGRVPITPSETTNYLSRSGATER